MTPTESFRQARDFLLARRTDYEGAVANFRWPELDEFNWALDWFDAIAAGNPRPALWLRAEGGGDEVVSFAAMAERSNRVANFLRRLGVKRGDRVMLMLGNVAPLWETMLACMKLGAVVIPATTLLSQDDIADRMERGHIKHLVADAALTAKFDAVDPAVTRIAVGGTSPGWHDYAGAAREAAGFTPDGVTMADDPLFLYFTSGTTTKPKLVLHSHRSLPVGSLSTMFWIGLLPGDIHLNISSPGWAKHAWSCLFAPWAAEATIFIFNQPRFRAKPMLDAMADAKVTSFCAPPTVWRMMIQEDLAAWDLSLREVTGAGEPLNAEVIDQVEAAWGLTIRDGYGQTETTAQIANIPGAAVVPGSMGRPLPGYTIELLDSDDNKVEEGEICIALDGLRPAGLMRGYAKGHGIEPVEGSYYRTGDVARRDANGLITYVGRADDVFKASDYRISPFELESALIEHAAVAEAAVVPSPDPLRLAVPKAFIALAPGHEPTRETALAIMRHARESLAPYKRVRCVEFAELPKTISGKIKRAELRKSEAERRQTGTRSDMEWWEEDFPELK